MAQHFSQAKKYRDLTIYDITELNEEEAYLKFMQFRWPDENQIQCPDCKYVGSMYRRPARKQLRCKKCLRDFSVTTGTPFANRKLSFKKLLFIIFTFISSPKGCAANKLLSEAKVTLRTAYLNLMKLREVQFHAQDKTPINGIAQIDGGHFCGKPRRGKVKQKSDSYVINNKLKNRKDAIVPDLKTHPESWNIEKLKNRRIVLVLKELPLDPTVRGSLRTITTVVMSENTKSVMDFVLKHVVKGSVIQTDGGNAYKQLPLYYNHQFVNHSVEYQTESGVNNNQAESFISRLRRGEYGIYHGMRPQYFAFYVSECAWREGVKKLTLKEKLANLMTLVMKSKVSKGFTNYCRGQRLANEYIGV
jgi:transposase-like protein